MTFSIIQKSQLEGPECLEAEYYQPEYLEMDKKLRKVGYLELLSLISKISDGTHFTPNYLQTGTPFLSALNVEENFLDFNVGFQHISEKDHSVLYRRCDPKPMDVLLRKVGVGPRFACVVPQVNNEFSLFVSVAMIRTKTDSLNPYFLSTFINSYYGQKQLIRFNKGVSQPDLHLEDIKRLKVPLVSMEEQENVANIILQSTREFKDFENFYEQAENLLLEELGLKDFKVPEDLSYIVNYSDAKKVDRVDADYFQLKYEFLINKLRNKIRLSEFAKRINPSFKIDSNRKYNYIEISDVNVGTGEVISNKIIGKELPANVKIRISGGELIISKVRPTRGAIAIIPDEYGQDFVASGAFSTFKVDSPVREYLQVVLRSLIGKLQMERPTTGTSYPTITDQDVENIWIPNVKIEIQTKIANLVKRSHEARKKSKELLEEAKRKVEEMVEKGGTN